jgi:hypothetical protein
VTDESMIQEIVIRLVRPTTDHATEEFPAGCLMAFLDKCTENEEVTLRPLRLDHLPNSSIEQILMCYDLSEEFSQWVDQAIIDQADFITGNSRSTAQEVDAVLAQRQLDTDTPSANANKTGGPRL